MVQKSYYAMLLEDIRDNEPFLYAPEFVNQLRENDFKFNAKTNKILQKQFGAEWKDKCERSLLLAKMLGNIYTGSLYNGLITLLCDSTIDLDDKNIMLFSYGSGCAASMFVARVKPGYKYSMLVKNMQFKERLDQRVRVSAKEYDSWMAHRESLFGKCNFMPTGSLDNLLPGTFYLTHVDEAHRRFYKIKEAD